MSHNDFCCLQLSDLCERPKLASQHVHPSPAFSTPRTCSANENYVPVNYIPDEVLAMIKAWEFAQQGREAKEASDTFDMPVDSAASKTICPKVIERIVQMRCRPNDFIVLYSTFGIPSRGESWNATENPCTHK